MKPADRQALRAWLHALHTPPGQAKRDAWEVTADAQEEAGDQIAADVSRRVAKGESSW